MAVYIGGRKNTSAVKTALQINAMVREINTLMKKEYPNTSYRLLQSIGVDTSKLFIARTGIRKYNDLVWVGRAANYAAKLCQLGDETYPTHITTDVFNSLLDDAKYGGQNNKLMWEKVNWTERGITVYKSSWYWGG